MDEIIGALNDVSATRYLAVTAFVLTIYDWAIRFDEEFELVGKSRLCLGKVLYYFTRVITPVGLAFGIYQLSEFRSPLTREFCIIATFINPTLECVSLLASYWLLMLRLVALYRSKPWVVWLLYFTLFSSYIATFSLLLCAQIYFAEYVDYIPSIGICATTSRAPTIGGVFYAPFAFESLLFGLTLFHASHDYRTQRESSALPLLRVMYRDGILLFFVMAGVRIWNIFIVAAQPVTRMYLGIYLMWAVITTLSNRIYLNMVSMAKHKALDRLQGPQTTNSVAGRGTFPEGIETPHATGTRCLTLHTRNSELFYSEYFEDQFSLEHFTDGAEGRVME